MTDLEPFEIPEKGIPEEDLMLYQATYELEFPFDSPPEFLTFQQDITDENYIPVSYTHLRAHETGRNLVCRLLLEKKNNVFLPLFLIQPL